MTARGQWLTVLGVVALLAAALGGASYFLRDELFQVSVGGKAPPFTAAPLTLASAPTAAGDVPANATVPAVLPATRSLADYRGQVILLNIWATWCAPCRQEMPSIEALYKQFAGRGFKVVAVSIDEPGDTTKIRRFVDEFHLTFDVLHDGAGKIQQIYQTTGVPENFLIGADGTIRKKAYTQDWNSEPNRTLVARLLDEAGTPAGPR